MPTPPAPTPPSREESNLILSLVHEGKITPEEAEQLIRAMESTKSRWQSMPAAFYSAEYAAEMQNHILLQIRLMPTNKDESLPTPVLPP
ncbi:MAG: hypothetical protein H0T73_20050 [Ardenticatenales bacterium]|nr:hypothetical protein [Ardenticatenales bacterium]